MLHPDGLMKNDIAKPENGSGDVVVKEKLLDMDKAARVDLAVGVFVRAEIIGAIAHGDFFVNVVEEDGTLDGRAQGGDQIAVIPASVHPATVEEAYPPRPLVTSHSLLSDWSRSMQVSRGIFSIFAVTDKW